MQLWLRLRLRPVTSPWWRHLQCALVLPRSNASLHIIDCQSVKMQCATERQALALGGGGLGHPYVLLHAVAAPT